MNSSSQLTFAQIFSALFRHKFKSLFMFALVLAVVISAFLLLPRKYGSEGQLFVQLGRGNSGLNPTTGGIPVSIQDSRETEIRSVLEIVKSRAVLENVIKRESMLGGTIGDQILESRFSLFDLNLPVSLGRSAKSPDEAISEDEFKMLRRQELAIKRLNKSTSVDSQKKTSVISIYAKASSATLASEIVDAMMKEARQKHKEVHQVEGSTGFFEAEYERQQNELDQALTLQQEFRQKHDFLSVQGQRDTLQMVEDKLASDLINAKAAFASAQKNYESIKFEMSKISEQVAMPTRGREKRAFENSETSLMALRQELAGLLASKARTHPEVRQVQDQINLMERQLGSMKVDRTETIMALNPVFEKVKTQLVLAGSTLDGAKARLAALEQEKITVAEKRKELGVLVQQGARLQRNVDLANQFLGNYRTKLGEARVLDQLDKDDITDLVVAQNGTRVVKHISPRGSILLPCGLIAALLTALATALFFERNRLSAGLSEAEVEQILDLPVLVTLPRVYSSRNMVN